MHGGAAIDRVARLRQAYADQCAALPWLDACPRLDDPPAFPGHACWCGLSGVRVVELGSHILDPSGQLRGPPGPTIVRHRADVSGPIAGYDRLLSHLAQAGIPLSVLHTDVPVQVVARLAERYRGLPLIVESGPLKLLYHIAECEALLREYPNTYLCTYNLCNWMGVERLCRAGLGGRLLFGTHAPRYSPHAAMGPVAFAEVSWVERCLIAGNNLRRILAMPPWYPPEPTLPDIAPFIIDAHAHSGPNGRFPVADEGFSPEDWLRAMDCHGIDRMVLCPYEALVDPSVSSAEQSRALRAAVGGRVKYFDVFDPRSPESLSRVAGALADPECAGVKMHPSFHETPADDQGYGPLFDLAEETGTPVLTHSWDASPTNPLQHLSHPSRFRRHLSDHPGVTLVLGHAGGRPGAMESVVALRSEFPNVHVDLAGDYYDSGLIGLLADQVGAERVLFGSDLDWVDPRANLAPVLASDLSDEEVYGVLRGNALRVYWREGRGDAA